MEAKEPTQLITATSPTYLDRKATPSYRRQALTTIQQMFESAFSPSGKRRADVVPLQIPEENDRVPSHGTSPSQTEIADFIQQQGISPFDVVENAFRGGARIVGLGEAHGNLAMLQFARELVPHLEKLGVTHIAFEPWYPNRKPAFDLFMTAWREMEKQLGHPIDVEEFANRAFTLERTPGGFHFSPLLQEMLDHLSDIDREQFQRFLNDAQEQEGALRGISKNCSAIPRIKCFWR